MPKLSLESGEESAEIVDQSDFSERAERLAQLYAAAARILDELDDLGLHQAGGYLSMAMDAILQAQWEEPKPE